MNVVVLGAGVIGVTTAYYMAKDGASVTVIDRQPGAGLETSYANGGQISANHVTPWATPSTPWKALRWLGRSDAPLLLHARWDPALAAWLARFLANCTRARVRINIERALGVALESRRQIARLRAETGIVYDALTRGILHIFRDPRDFHDALPGADLMTSLGCERRVVDAEGCIALEPALASVRDQLVGGIFSPQDESGDAHVFTRELARVCAERGVVFRFGETVRRLRPAAAGGARRIAAVETDRDEIEADVIIVALASFSPRLLAPLGLRLPVYPAKGYSVTVPVAGHAGAPTVSLIDDAFKMVYSRLGERLRIAGTGEFIGHDVRISEARGRFLLRTALELFPDCGDAGRAEFWAGLRPATPDGVPVIGRTGFENLFLNTGHGTLGWTMAAGSARILADVIAGRPAPVPLDGLALDRFA
ncbi:MAG: D-amino acid dehydrogenase [Rhodospirillales bacterium]|nr:D-amino acid dehydrogenase [Rhodospirillales bacterium]